MIARTRLVACEFLFSLLPLLFLLSSRGMLRKLPGYLRRDRQKDDSFAYFRQFANMDDNK